MATHQFKFVVSDVDLTPEQIKRIGGAVTQAGALALAEMTPDEDVTFRISPGILWKGIPPVDVVAALTAHVSEQVSLED